MSQPCRSKQDNNWCMGCREAGLRCVRLRWFLMEEVRGKSSPFCVRDSGCAADNLPDP